MAKSSTPPTPPTCRPNTATPPAPPTRRPNIEERISMLQMATLHHTGYKPKKGMPLALPELPMVASKTKKSTRMTGPGIDEHKGGKRNRNKKEKNKKIVKERVRFVLRLGDRNKTMPAEDVWVRLVQEGTSNY